MMTNQLKTAAAIMALAAGFAWASGPWVVSSDETALDTRGKLSLAADTDQEVDTRSYTEERSSFSKIDTRINRGTLIMVK